MEANFYKLGEYKIIESDTGELVWEAHSGFGSLQEGRCFKKGSSILFIGPVESEHLGLLKAEFLEQLKPLPAWLKTNYYCKGLEVYHCETDKKITKEDTLLWRIDRTIEGGVYRSEKREREIDGASAKGIGDASYRLRKYEIIRKANGQVVWKTDTGPNTVSGGAGTILEDILFIGPPRDEQFRLNKRMFRANLTLLPKWDQTTYYCSNLSLNECVSGAREDEPAALAQVKPETATNGHGYKGAIAISAIKGAWRESASSRIRIWSFFNTRSKPWPSLRVFDGFAWLRSQKVNIGKFRIRLRGSAVRKGIIYTIASSLLIKDLLSNLWNGSLKKYYGKWRTRFRK